MPQRADEPKDEQERLTRELARRDRELADAHQELRRAHEALAEARGRAAQRADEPLVGHCRFDAQGRLVEIDPAAARMLDGECAGLVGRSLASLDAVDDPQAFAAHLRRCVTAAQRVTAELGLGRGARTVELVSTPLAGDGGEVSGCSTAITDVTSRRAEARLRLLAEAGTLLASSIDHCATVSVVARLAVPLLGDRCFVDLVEEDGRIDRLEPAALEPPDGRALPQPSDAIDAATPQAEVLRSGRPLIRADGPSLLVVPLVARGCTIGALSCEMAAPSSRRHGSAELTLALELASRAAMAIDNARLYRAAQRAIAAREDVLTIVSHDLENPLQGIRLNCEFLLSMVPPERDRRQGRVQLESIRRGVAEMHRMIGALADLSLLEAGGLRLAWREHDAATLVDDAVALERAVADRKGVQLRRRVAPGRVPVACDRARIVQVLSSLIASAVQSTPRGGTVGVDAALEGDRVHVVVRDGGDGARGAQLPERFERQSWRNGAAARPRRAALGLYLVRGVIDAHGGVITVDNDLGPGTAVSFTLPREVPAPATSPSLPERTRPKA